MFRIIMISVFFTAALSWAVPAEINQQGKLTTSSGVPLSGPHDLSFRIYDGFAIDANLLWSEDHPDVPITDGLYSVALGSVTPFPGNLFDGSLRYLEVEVDGDGPMTPRLPMNSVPYSMRSGKSDSFTVEGVAQLLALFQSLPDADGDGETKVSQGGTDCDDLNPLINSAGNEVCDGADNNCNGQVDEGFVTIWYLDFDQDGYGNSDSTIISCDSIPGYVSIGGDCRDDNPAIHPGAEELCNLLDDNCDGVVEEVGSIYPDADGDGYGAIVPHQFGCLFPGWSTESGDCNDADSTIHPNRPEICDGIDQDCNGIVDDNTPGCTLYFADVDSDGWGDDYNSSCLCAPQLPFVLTEGGDCFDNNPLINPGMAECENGIDDNCDEIIDGPGSLPCTVYYIDFDQDGFGDAGNAQCQCIPYWPFTATAIGDCDDNDPGVNPAASEICNDFIDNDCDGYIDAADSDCP